jgi:RNA polymerase sigma factor (sigma-70 family)
MRRVGLPEFAAMHAGHTQIVLQQLRRAVRPEGDAGDGELLDAFILRRDEQAFAALLRRHGPMVWGVCRRLAGQVPDAEDAFQAVFLILVRKAGCVRPRERVGAWLHGVAFRTAQKARRLAERRRAREKQIESIERPTAESSLPDADLLCVIDEELHRLPERLRLPVLLCDVQGRPQRDVAHQLSIPVGTLGHRLDSARRILARRLTRRGVTLSLALLATAAVPKSLSAVTRRAALALAAGRDLASLVPPQIVALIEGALTMTRSKVRLAGAFVLLAVLGGIGLHAAQRPALMAGENEPAKPPAAKPTEPPADDATFLRRLSLDLRGILPTEIELKYFLADKDPTKRRKVAGWMLQSVENPLATDAAQRFAQFSEAIRAAEQSQTERGLRQLGEQLRQLPPSQPKPETPGDPSTASKLVEDLMKHYLDQAAKPVDPTKPAEVERQKQLLDQLYDMIDKAPPPQKDPVKQSVNRAIEFLRKEQESEKALSADERKARVEKRQADYRSAQALAELALRESGAAPETPPGASAQRLAEELAFQWYMMGQKSADGSTDAEFLRRLMLDLLGKPPTIVELNYFLADKDPNKRKKVTEWLMSYPEVANKYWKMRAARLQPTSAPGGDRFDKLLAELLAGSRGDEQILDALTLATLARFPTESDRQFLGVYLKSNGDRRAAWTNVLYVLTNTQEFRQHAASLQSRAK